jgi:hypothetical protein
MGCKSRNDVTISEDSNGQMKSTLMKQIEKMNKSVAEQEDKDFLLSSKPDPTTADPIAVNEWTQRLRNIASVAEKKCIADLEDFEKKALGKATSGKAHVSALQTRWEKKEVKNLVNSKGSGNIGTMMQKQTENHEDEQMMAMMDVLEGQMQMQPSKPSESGDSTGDSGDTTVAGSSSFVSSAFNAFFGNRQP